MWEKRTRLVAPALLFNHSKQFHYIRMPDLKCWAPPRVKTKHAGAPNIILTAQTSELVLPGTDEWVPATHGTHRLASFPADAWATARV